MAKLIERLSRLEERGEAVVSGHGVSSILAACVRTRKNRITRGLNPDDAPPPLWAVNIRAAMARHRQELQA